MIHQTVFIRGEILLFFDYGDDALTDSWLFSDDAARLDVLADKF